MKTAHQFARELLAMPDLPILHFDPSFADACDEETDHTTGEPSATVNDPCDGLTADEIDAAKERGFAMGKFITIEGDQPAEYDRAEVIST